MRQFAPVGALVLASCAMIGVNTAAYDAPTYSYQGIELSGVLDGRLTVRDGCLVLTDPQNRVFQLIWPDRTSFTPDLISFDNGKRRLTVPLGTTVRLFGGFNELTPSNATRHGTARCLGEAFLVNSLETAE